MGSGIRATVEFSQSDVCPVAEVATAADDRIDSVATSVALTEDSPPVTEFSVETESDPDEDVVPVFSHGSTYRYRLTHDGGVSCPCECLGTHGCPVTRYVARDGRLTVVFHAADYEELRAVVGDLRERFPKVDIKRFVKSPAGETTADSAFVDLSRLTARQLETLETAHEMGYFEQPRRANATEVAEALDISPSTFSEHLAAAQSKILADVL